MDPTSVYKVSGVRLIVVTKIRAVSRVSDKRGACGFRVSEVYFLVRWECYVLNEINEMNDQAS